MFQRVSGAVDKLPTKLSTDAAPNYESFVIMKLAAILQPEQSIALQVAYAGCPP